MQPITIGNIDYTQDEKGNWIHKAKPSTPLTSGVKPKYREQPQFKLQNIIEGNSKKRFGKVLHVSTLEITKFLKENI